MVDAAGRVLDSSLGIAQDELELARLEIVQKLPKLGRNLISLAIASFLGLFGLLLALAAIAWLLGEELFEPHIWLGFAVTAAVALAAAGSLALAALRQVPGSIPFPSAALRHARSLKEVVGR
ncbi:MAG TPA: phage holin family protein [Solirubrobacteraceae bacterium]|jgi:hypothetical protein|nr:phage holin family protein [Solirubrobacteraceae bacterium]